MRKSLIFCVLLLSVALGGSAAEGESVDSLWNKANVAYRDANYMEAVRIYETILGQGLESDKLYMNLGNAYFKQNMKGKAILNYNRALKLSPSDKDTRYNLKIANTYVQDKIEVVPVFFVNRWIRALYSLLGVDTWAMISLFVFVVMLAGILVYLLLTNVLWRKIGFYTGIIGMGLFIVTVAFADLQRNRLLNSREAIVMSISAPIKSSPDAGSKDIFVLHEGTKVVIQETLGDYSEVMVADGNKGWILTSSIEMID